MQIDPMDIIIEYLTEGSVNHTGISITHIPTNIKVIESSSLFTYTNKMRAIDTLKEILADKGQLPLF